MNNDVQDTNSPKSPIAQANSPVDLKNTGNIPKTINGNVSYLNLV